MTVQLGPTKLPTLFSTKSVKASYATIMAYSMPRFGKTNLIRTLLLHGFKPLIVATDQGDSMGLQTISDLDIPVAAVTNWDEAIAVFTEINKDRGAGKMARYGDYEFDVIVNDSLSGFGEIWMEKGLEVLNWKEVGVAQPGHDPRRIYAYIPEKGRQTAKALMNVKAHCILLCRETMLEEGEGPSKIQYPAPELPGAKLPRELPGWLDAVVFGKIVSGERKFMTAAEGKVVAGIRAAPNWRLPQYVKADYGLLIKYMMGDQAAFDELSAVKPSKVPSATSTQSTTTRVAGVSR
jgi:hypothetical protein